MTLPNDPDSADILPPGVVVALQDMLRRCRQERDELADQLKAASSELVAARQALQASRQREAQARQMISHDALTGLPNRVAFGRQCLEALAAHAQSKRSFGLLFVDLDGFKSVNDGLGHAAGDALLAVVGARLAHALRQGDFVSRHGGDEFVCLLAQVGDDELALSLAGKLRDVISAPCRIGDDVVTIRASIGVALFPRDGASAAALLDRADQAMLWAKAQQLGIGLASRTPVGRPQAASLAAINEPMRMFNGAVGHGAV